jgi:hypothetical protein
MRTQSRPFTTSDLHLAAFLLAQGCPILSPRLISPRRIEFVFAEAERCESFALEFVSGRGMIEARRFLDAQGQARDIRDLALGIKEQPKTGAEHEQRKQPLL